jgi:PAS domain S-box-containing protein
MSGKGTILLIEDEKVLRFTLENILSDEGYNVAAVQNFNEAIDKLSKHNFDLIFADIILGSGKTGIDILKEVKDMGIKCPVVIFTGYPSVETASEAVRLDAFDYIPKPVRKNTLLHVTRKALEYKALYDENEKYRLNLEAIFKSVSDGIISVDSDLSVIEINESAINICGFSCNKIKGEKFTSLSKLCSGKCIEVLKETVKTKKSMEVNHLECEHKKRPSQIVDVITSLLLNRHGLFSGAVMILRDETRLNYLEQLLNERIKFHNIIGRSRVMQKIYSSIENLADLQTTVLITGESGTGKELVAEALHYKGVRRDKPLVKVNCTAIPENLIESELFGHVKGAFTGAVKDNIGRFKKADKGTIFLDEIGDMTQVMQLRLLRVLQEMEFERVGDSTPIKVDVRVLAATNQNLQEKVKEGQFRKDLYYRLKVVEITLPPLRERHEDITLLMEYFLEKFNKKFNKNIKSISEEVKNLFTNYPWPGNIRELEHVMEYASIYCKTSIITVENLPSEFHKGDFFSLEEKADEAQEIREVLIKTGWNKAKAARILGMHRTTLYQKIKIYQITDRQDTME